MDLTKLPTLTADELFRFGDQIEEACQGFPFTVPWATASLAVHAEVKRRFSEGLLEEDEWGVHEKKDDGVYVTIVHYYPEAEDDLYLDEDIAELSLQMKLEDMI